MSTYIATFNRAAVVSSVEQWTNFQADAVFDTNAASVPERSYLICGTDPVPDDIKYKQITAVSFYCYVYEIYSSSYYKIDLRVLADKFDEGSITFADIDWDAVLFLDYVTYAPDNSWCEKAFSSSFANIIGKVINNGLILELEGSIESPTGTNKPYFELTYGDENAGLNITPNYPIGSATISKSIPTTFSWTASPQTKNTLVAVTPQSAVIRWRYLGESSYTEIPCETPTEITLPGNTFAEGTIQWQVEVTANSGAVTTSEWATTEVKEPTSSAIASYPVNAVLDGSAEQTFRWEHVISNGTAQQAFELQTSPDGSSWATIRTAETEQTSATFEAGTFDAGELWWRVRTYNLEGVAGDWSEAAHCIVIAAPEAPSITVDDTSPKFVLRWQQSGQQAYELMVDGTIIAKKYTAESLYKHTGYLDPGAHVVKIRIQNKYQMWSDWGIANLQIENLSGSAIQLTAIGKNEVLLSWITSDEYTGYIVYRNGARIAETTETSFIDHFAVGETMYQVRGVYADSGYYTLSNISTVTIIPETMMIADVKSPLWINLPLSASSLRATGINASQSVTYTHYVGNDLPSAEVGEAVTKSYDLECAFKITDLGRIRQFETLLGKTVCIKTPSQRRIFGVVSQMTASENRFYVAYRLPITEIKWEEYTP